MAVLQPNALKVTMLFPIYGNDGSPFPASVWDWWTDSIESIGAYHKSFAAGSWEGQHEYHRRVSMILETGEQLARLERFLAVARDIFGQQVMYFEGTNVHFKLI